MREASVEDASSKVTLTLPLTLALTLTLTSSKEDAAYYKLAAKLAANQNSGAELPASAGDTQGAAAAGAVAPSRWAAPPPPAAP